MKRVRDPQGFDIDFIEANDAVGRMSDSYDKPDGALDHDEYMAALNTFGLEGLGDLGADIVKPQPQPEQVVVSVPRSNPAWSYGTIGGAALFLGAAVVFWMWTQKGK